LLISGDFNLRRRSSAASPLSLGDPASPPKPPGAAEPVVDGGGGARDPTDAIRLAVPMRGAVRGERGTGGSGGSGARR